MTQRPSFDSCWILEKFLSFFIVLIHPCTTTDVESFNMWVSKQSYFLGHLCFLNPLSKINSTTIDYAFWIFALFYLFMLSGMGGSVHHEQVASLLHDWPFRLTSIPYCTVNQFGITSPGRFNPRTLLLWGDSGNCCTCEKTASNVHQSNKLFVSWTRMIFQQLKMEGRRGENEDRKISPSFILDYLICKRTMTWKIYFSE